MPKSLSAGVVPVHFVKKKPHVLLLRVYKYWDFPKGIVEKGEDPLTAAVRELEEETGLKKIAFTWGKDFTETAPYAGGKTARYYLGETKDSTVEIKANPVTGIFEHHEFRWLAFADAHALLVPRVRLVLEWAVAKVEASS